MSHFFIERPIFASVLSIIITLCGVVALAPMAVALYPPIAPPMVQVSCAYPGADAGVVSEAVASPIEQVVNGVDNLLYMQSQCTNDGNYLLFLTFEVGADLDVALVEVQNRIQLAMPRLPDQVRKQGVNVRKKSPDVLLAISFISPDNRYDDVYMSNYATIQVKDELLRLYGVGDVVYLGQRDYSIRAWLDPDKLATRNLTTNEVVQALNEQNQQVVCGSTGSEPATDKAESVTVLTAQGRLTTPEDFGAIVVKTGEPSPNGVDVPLVHLRDIARVELGAQQYGLIASLDGESSVTLAVFQVPGTNALKTAEGIKAKMAELGERFPEGLEYRIVYDTTPFIRDSVDEVVTTLLLAILLVALVVLVFLQNWRAALIPLIAVPVAIIGTFAPMAAVGFDINTLSLFGLVLAIGIVVDDAIVVVENVERWIEQGLSPREAAHRAMDEVTGPIIGVALVLSAVFLPCAFFAGVVGQFYRQFALTIAISTVISAFNSLTLSPALAALLLRPRGGPNRDFFTRFLDAALGWFFRRFNASFERGTQLYTQLVERVLNRCLLGAAVYVALFVLTGWGFAHWQIGFIPTQDQGYLVLNVRLPEGASVQWTQEVMAKIDKIARGDQQDADNYPGIPGVAHTVGISGHSLVYNASASNWGSMFIVLAPFDERRSGKLGAANILDEMQQRCNKEVPDALVALYPAPPIRGLSTGGGFKLYVEDHASIGYEALQGYADKMADTAGRTLPDVSTIFDANSPQMFIDVDRAKVRALQVNLKDVFDTLQTYMGGRYINSFNRFGRTWQVNAMAREEFRTRTDQLLGMKVRNQRGEMVSLASLVTLRDSNGPNVVMRYNLYEAAPIITTPTPGLGPGTVMETFKSAAAQDLGQDVTYEWTEIMYLQIIAGNTAPILFALGIVLVFLVLSALYESWSLPFVVLLVVPMGLLSALAGLVIANNEIDILAQIGLVVLVGLASKNAILIVEFAKLKCDEGMPAREATLEACLLRLRPILMTSFAFILGVVPLLIASGAGAEMRHSLGIAVFSGMIGVTLFGLFLTPLFFYLSRNFAEHLPGVVRLSARTRRSVLLTVSFLLFGFLGTHAALHWFGSPALQHEGYLILELRALIARVPLIGEAISGLLGHVPPLKLVAFGLSGAAGTLLMLMLMNAAPLVCRHVRERLPRRPGSTHSNEDRP